MNVNIQSLNKESSQLASFVERRVRMALRRRADLAPQVTVWLEDVNGPRGGPDKECRIAVRTERHGTVVARALSTTWRRALHAALLRVAQLLARVLGRKQTQRRTAKHLPDAV